MFLTLGDQRHRPDPCLKLHADRRRISRQLRTKTPSKSRYVLPAIHHGAVIHSHSISALSSLPDAAAVAVLAGAAAAYHTLYAVPAAACQQVANDPQQQDDNEFANWSETHKVRPKHLFEPETDEDLQRVVAKCHESGMYHTRGTQGILNLAIFQGRHKQQTRHMQQPQHQAVGLARGTTLHQAAAHIHRNICIAM